LSEDASPKADPFGPERWAVDAVEVSSAALAPAKRRPGRRGRFLKGPIPWPWLARAMVLPGKALAVGLMLWQLRGMTGRNPVLFCLPRAEAEGIAMTTARRAIRALEGTHLVAVERRPGRGLEVTILNAPAKGDER
jgi:hypothetical protein